MIGWPSGAPDRGEEEQDGGPHSRVRLRLEPLPEAHGGAGAIGPGCRCRKALGAHPSLPTAPIFNNATRLSLPAALGPSSTGITDAQGPARWQRRRAFHAFTIGRNPHVGPTPALGAPEEPLRGHSGCSVASPLRAFVSILPAMVQPAPVENAVIRDERHPQRGPVGYHARQTVLCYTYR